MCVAFRIGVHRGDSLEGSDPTSDGVNTAVWLEKIAEPARFVAPRTLSSGRDANLTRHCPLLCCGHCSS